ncbi:MAG: ribonuclease III [Chloroflexota bacterium]|nr:ribonuclease III [Chloroflexota bacterium]MDE2941861.1 ribonuclease III [Chloroflexota bacterium]MDE3268333.1 ribonuclease III [Chloroflexota bacterium]
MNAEARAEPPACLEQRLVISFSNGRLLAEALTHPSVVNEDPQAHPTSNQRLEFLGDALIGLVAARELYRLLPGAHEGSLTELRAAVVRGETLARVAGAIELGAYLRLGQGEEANGGRERESNLASAFEALVGAVLLDRGAEEACDVALRLIRPEVERVVREGAARDPKSRLQEVTQGLGMGSPAYNTASQTGPEQDRVFHIEVMVAGRVMGSGSGRRKVDGERAAALEALALLSASGESST